MKERKKIIKEKSEFSVNESWETIDNNSTIPESDRLIFEQVSSFMKAKFDIEDAENDFTFDEVNKVTKSIVADYSTQPNQKIENLKFIRDNLNWVKETYVKNEESIESDIRSTNVDIVTKEWVRNWQVKQHEEKKDSKRKEIRDFINQSFKKEVINEYHKPIQNVTRIFKFHYIRYLILTAAILTGVVFGVRTFITSSDPEKIFEKYYSPLAAITEVTRSSGNKFIPEYSMAIENYLNGKYQEASINFSDLFQNDSSFISVKFFQGITKLAIGDYDEAVKILSSIEERQYEFSKETKWYLGLALLKTGNKSKATECFTFLEKSPGFYSSRSTEILRRLK